MLTLEYWLLVLVIDFPMVIALLYLIHNYRDEFNKSILKVIFTLILLLFRAPFDLLWVLDLDITEVWLKRLADIGTILSYLGRILFLQIFLNSAINRMTLYSARFAIFGSSILLGVRLATLVSGDGSFFGIVYDDHWRLKQHPVISLLSIITFIIIFFTVFGAIRADNKLPGKIIPKDALIYGRFFIVFMSLAISSAILLSLFSTSNFANEQAKILFVISRIFVTLAMSGLVLYVSTDPVLLFYEKLHLHKLIENGSVGWVVAFMTDMGPQAINYSECLKTIHNLTNVDFTAFSAGTITIVGLNDTFEKSSFTMPFPSKQPLYAFCVTFFHKDPETKDPRLKTTSVGVFAIVLPNALIGSIKKINVNPSILDKMVDETISIHEFSTTERMDRLAIDILNQIF